jgi:LysR family glycine cleavage system transcriptional activator
MNSHLPPLGALRAFEAAARHMSFSRAAAELHVTPAAVSHQIHALEQDLGVKLFHRLNRSIELTLRQNTAARLGGHAGIQLRSAMRAHNDTGT